MNAFFQRRTFTVDRMFHDDVVPGFVSVPYFRPTHLECPMNASPLLTPSSLLHFVTLQLFFLAVIVVW